MNILLYANSHLPKIGGREIVVHQLATNLLKLGHSVRLIGPGGVRKRRGMEYGYPIDRWFHVPLLGKEQGWKLHLAKTRLRYKFDLIHAHTTYPTGFMAVTNKSLLRTPVVITPHGHDINVAPELGIGMRIDPTLDEKVGRALEGADAITAISDQVAASIVSTGVSQDRITRIANGVDTERFSRTQSVDIRQHFDIPANDKVVVAVGNYRPLKGHEVLIDSVRRVRDEGLAVSCVFVGAPSRELVVAAKDSGEDHWLKFVGSIGLPNKDDPDLLAAVLQQADAYVSASIDNSAEGMSLATLEAMASGCAIIATDVSGNRDLLGVGNCGFLVEPNKVNAIVEALNRVLSDANLSEQLKAGALSRAQHFSWEQVTREYISVYESLL